MTNNRIDYIVSAMNTQKEDHQRLVNKVETFNINIGKCYDDLLEFKDNMSDLLMTFKIEMLVNQEKLAKDLQQLAEFRKTNEFND